MRGFSIDNEDQIRRKLGFMFKKISMSQKPMTYWLSLPEFLDDIQSLIDSNITINDESVYKVLSRIYFEEEEFERRTGLKSEFDFKLARSGIYQLMKVLRNDKQQRRRSL